MAMFATNLIGFLVLEGMVVGFGEGIARTAVATKEAHLLLDMMTPQKREVKVEVEGTWVAR